MIDWNEQRYWLELANFASIGVVGLYTWFANRQRITLDRLQTMETSIEGKIGGLSERLAVVEGGCARCTGMPIELEKIYKRLVAIEVHIASAHPEGTAAAAKRLNDIEGMAREMHGSIIALTRQMDLLYQSLLDDRAQQRAMLDRLNLMARAGAAPGAL